MQRLHKQEHKQDTKPEGNSIPSSFVAESGDNLPYEFRALESILASVLEALHIELEGIRQLVFALLASLDHNIDREKLRALLAYRRKVGDLLSRSRGVKGAVAEVLESDEDMALMHLTDAAKGQPRTAQSLAWQYDSLELLLESFDKQLEEVISYTDQMQANIGGTQEIVELILDSNRNQLLALELHVSIATLGFTGGALIASFFGMNLHTGLEENPMAFSVVCVSALAVVATCSAAGIRKIKKIQRVGLGRARRSPLLLPVMRMQSSSVAPWSNPVHAPTSSSREIAPHPSPSSPLSFPAGSPSTAQHTRPASSFSMPWQPSTHIHAHDPQPRSGWWYRLRSRLPTVRNPSTPTHLSPSPSPSLSPASYIRNPIQNGAARPAPTSDQSVATDPETADRSAAPAAPSPVPQVTPADSPLDNSSSSSSVSESSASPTSPDYAYYRAGPPPPPPQTGRQKVKAWAKTLFFGPEPVAMPYPRANSVDAAIATVYAPGPFARQDSAFPDYSADLIGAGYSSNRWGPSRASKRAAANERQQNEKHDWHDKF